MPAAVGAKLLSLPDSSPANFRPVQQRLVLRLSVKLPFGVRLFRIAEDLPLIPIVECEDHAINDLVTGERWPTEETLRLWEVE